MRINIIAAIADDGAIGRDGQLLWHISEDLKFFKRTTMGSPVIMGSRTYTSIGRPLPGRLNIVISRSLTAEELWPGHASTSLLVVRSLDNAIELAAEAMSMRDGDASKTGSMRNISPEHVLDVRTSKITAKNDTYALAEGLTGISDRMLSGVGSEHDSNGKVLSDVAESGSGIDTYGADTTGGKDVYIIGGGQIYRQAVSIADRLVITHVHSTFPDADVHFPIIDSEIWHQTSITPLATDPATGLTYQFATYFRRQV